MYNIKHHVFQKYHLENIRFRKRYLSRRDLKEKNDTTSTHERRLGSVFCSAGDEPRNTMYILEQVFKKFITSPFGHDYTFYFII